MLFRSSCLRLRLAALGVGRGCKDQATQKAGSHRRQPANFSFLHGPCPCLCLLYTSEDGELEEIAEEPEDEDPPPWEEDTEE